MSLLIDVPIIVCACDDNFAMPLTVMLKSLMTNLKKYDQVILYILNRQIHESTKELLRESLNSLNININWVYVDDIEFKDMKLSPPTPKLFIRKPTPYTSTIYYRLLIPRLLPKEIKKVIYLDCDTLVLNDISHLWDQDVDNHYLLAVPEMWKKAMYVSSPYGLKTYKKLNIPAENKYFNSGVLVMNLEKWRRDDIPNKIINYLKLYQDDVMWFDQDGMNAILSGNWGELDPRWNVMTVLYKYRSWKNSPFDEKTYNQLIESPYIIHFTERSKPWHTNNNHPKRKLFLDFLNLTSWKHLCP